MRAGQRSIYDRMEVVAEVEGEAIGYVGNQLYCWSGKAFKAIDMAESVRIRLEMSQRSERGDLSMGETDEGRQHWLRQLLKHFGG
jgi:hypothetical protein